MKVPEDFGFSEKFDDLNERDHHIGQSEVIDAVFFGGRIHVSREFKRGRKRRRKILGFSDGLHVTIIVEIRDRTWIVLSAMPSNDADERYFDAHAINNPNILDDKPVADGEPGRSDGESNEE